MTDNRIIIITGAGSGIGAATVARLAAPDTSFLLSTRSNRDGLETVANAARCAGAQVHTWLGDLSEEGAASELVSVARDTFGGIDQIVSNAGKASKSAFRDLTRDDVLAAMSVNTLPMVELVTAAMDDLVQSSWGRVVTLSSFVTHDFGINGVLFPATSASKGAVEALTRALAFELAQSGVSVNCVAPGYTRKVGGHAAIGAEAWKAAAAATPNGKLAEPEDIAATIAFLLSRDAGHITGQVLRVDGGLSL
ncbi:SDR family NAD(P)-dependent oxidoreductase [Oceanibium sediminis]|uniref:SDR family NAD(P)-dependent oxidoreductase n=1 Tax=Oceanibium sediminis TaxID=2026339 RepID=UPI000DD3E701|nr:SDR family oxidoreductase [Oceanibium sediminis]